MELVKPSDLAPVTVVIPCYNSAGTVGRALVSALGQTFPPAEIIVVDDGSDDPKAVQQAIAVVTRAFPHYTGVLRLITLKSNCGPGCARNIGWDAAQNRYVAFLDSDDSWHPQKLEIQVNYMLKFADIAFTAHRWRLWSDWVRANNEEIRAVHSRVLVAKHVLLRNPISTPTVMVKRDLPFRFPPRRFSEDYELWLEILLAGYRGVLLEVPLAFLHKIPYGEGGLSGKLWAMELGELTTYWRLFKARKLRACRLGLCVVWSLGKFVRRSLISGLGRVLR